MSDESAVTGLRPDLSFEGVYSRHAEVVHRYCVTQVRELAAAEDLAHETFAKALIAYERVAPDPDEMRPWLLTIARNVCIDHARRRSRWLRLASRIAAEPQSVREVATEAERALDLRSILRALDRCSPTERQLIGLRVAADLPFREVAAVMGISEAATKAATYRALVKVRALVEKEQ